MCLAEPEEQRRGGVRLMYARTFTPIVQNSLVGKGRCCTQLLVAYPMDSNCTYTV